MTTAEAGPTSEPAGERDGAAPREPLAALAARRSVSPRRLGHPGPADADIERALQLALRAPDHGGLVPWRVIDFAASARGRLADLFADEKRRRAPDATTDDLARARAHALEPPTLLGFVARIDPAAVVPPHEQWLAAGAALGNLLNAFHLLGFGAIVLSGGRCADRPLAEALGIAAGERLAGFVSVGRVDRAPKPAAEKKPPVAVRTRWRG